jgi:LmbE family N-acetylglucosaminyl deacetylase
VKAVVLSPHFDDAVMSLGATINSLRRRGVKVVMLTAFGGDPNRNDLTSYWDAKRGAATKAHAQAMRRDEDNAATAVLTIESVPLQFDDFSYVARRDPDEIWEAMRPHLADADVVLTPGWPLVHPDHRYLSTLVVQRTCPGQVLFYQELPYGAQPLQVIKRSLRGRRAPTLAHAIGSDLTWRRTLTNADDFAAKRAAVACYEGELQMLGRSAMFARLHDRITRREVVGYTGTADAAQVVFGAVQ